MGDDPMGCRDTMASADSMGCEDPMCSGPGGDGVGADIGGAHQLVANRSCHVWSNPGQRCHLRAPSFLYSGRIQSPTDVLQRGPATRSRRDRLEVFTVWGRAVFEMMFGGPGSRRSGSSEPHGGLPQSAQRARAAKASLRHRLATILTLGLRPPPAAPGMRSLRRHAPPGPCGPACIGSITT